MKNYFRLLGITVLAAVLGFSITACEDASNNPDNSNNSNNTGDPGNPGDPSMLEGSWYSSAYFETFTFNVAEGTFTKMSDQGWGERGTFTVAGTVITFTITEAYDGGSWKAPNPNATLVWARPYSFNGNGDLVLYGTNVYVKKGPVVDPNTGGKAPYRILSIGASFTRDAMTFLRDMLIANGVPSEDIAIVNGYIGGQTLAGHALNARNESAAYTRQSFGTGGAMTSGSAPVTSKSLIESNDWDYISIQQGADQAGNSTAYNDEDIEYLISYIKQYASNPNVKIIFHMTWAYCATNTQGVWNSIYGGNQMNMYTMIVNTVQDKIVPKVTSGKFEFITPSGTAIQNARLVYGDTLNGDDGYHLNNKGKFIAGSLWLKKIFNKNIVGAFTAPYLAQGLNITLDDMVKIQKCVDDALAHPFNVTDQP